MARSYVLERFSGEGDLSIDYESELNPQQYAAVTAPPGPALVIAGAGSGKTRTLIYRVAYLLEQGVAPDRILLLTFTNKAAGEMMSRVSSLLERDLKSLWGGTFHSIGLRILRKHADRIERRRDFTILDREDGKDLISTCIAEAGVEVRDKRFPKPELLNAMFSLAVNLQESLEDTLYSHYPKFEEVSGAIEKVWKAYEARKESANLVDFDDLLILWKKLLEESIDVRELYQKQFQFVLVDEFQDTNKLQADIIDLMVAGHGNLTVVGDDAQSIYAWRGAYFKNILDFPERYPKTTVYKIETNYRSTPQILNLANEVIGENEEQFEKTLNAFRSEGMVPALACCYNSADQAAFVAQRVLELRDEGMALEEMAVLYRSHFHALELQVELTRRNIPYAITSGLRFFEQAHIKDITAFLRLLYNPLDEISFHRLVKMLPGIGGKTAEKLWGLYQASARELRDNGHALPVSTSLSHTGKKAPAKARTHWAQLTATMAQMEHENVLNKPAELIRMALEGCYEDYAEARFDNAKTRLDDIKELANFARTSEGLDEFLSQLALQTNLDTDRQDPEQDEEQLKLSTVHQAKGLEFRAVFVIMLCDGLFPSSRSIQIEGGEEEERRLFYVAITRAKEELYLCYPTLRSSYGAGPSLQSKSRFLHNLSSEFYEEWDLQYASEDVF